VNVVGRDQFQVELIGERKQPMFDGLIAADQVPLQLEKIVFSPEQILVTLGCIESSVIILPENMLSELTFVATRERDQTAMMILEQFPGECGFAFRVIELSTRNQSAEVRVAFGIFDQQGEMVALIYDDLGSDDGMNTELAGLHYKLDDSVQAIMIRERDRRHFEPCGMMKKGLRRGGAI